MKTTIPTHTQILVVGGGPAGSYTASVLAREGLQVVLLEAVQFPRYHIGESTLPSVRHHLRFIDAEQKLADFGFKYKPGAALKLNQSKREAYTDFVAVGPHNNAWNVTRADFDKLLLDHARESGANVYEGTKVTSLHFSDSGSPCPVSAKWTRSCTTDASGEIFFDFLVDASGRAGLMSDRYIKNRHYNESLRNIALWGYWTGVGTYGLEKEREGAPWFEALIDDSGWAWFIPLHDGTTSVGVVVHQKNYQARWRPGYSTLERYQALLSLAPNLIRLIGNGTLISKSSSSSSGSSPDTLVRSASDFSYSAPQYAGDRFRIVGDAGAFIDPLFSSGIHLAMTSALSAAASICGSIRGDCPETTAAAWHTKRFTLSYTRYQMVVLSAYQQIRATQLDVLNDVNEDSYERAFTFLRPVIQGASDMGTRLSEGELQNALEFCSKFFSPTSPDQRAQALHCGLPVSFFDASLAPVDPKEMQVALDSAGASLGCSAHADDVRMVMEQVNARRVVYPELLVNNVEVEEIDGYVMRFQRGSLGLSRAGVVKVCDQTTAPSLDNGGMSQSGL